MRRKGGARREGKWGEGEGKERDEGEQKVGGTQID